MQAKSFAVSYSLLLALVSSNVLTALAQPGGYGGYGGYESPPPIPRHFNGMGGWDRGYGTGSGSYGAGSWGGWSRPNHRFHRYGWGSWATPYYAGGPGYGAANMSTVDEQGALYESRNYYIPDPNGITIPSVSGPYGWTSGTVTLMSEEKRKAAQPKIEHVALTSKYRLGPDTDVLEGGIIALHLTKDANLLVTAGNTRLVDQSGIVVATLATDPTLLWHLGSEIDRQSLSLKAALARNKSVATAAQNAQSKPGGESERSRTDSKSGSDSTVEKNGSTTGSASDSVPKSTPSGASKDAQETKNLADSVALLELAATKLGKRPDNPPEVKPPESDSIELFASVWITRDGHYISFKGPEGTIAYIDSKGIYSDRGKTPVKVPYPGKLEVAVYGFLKNLLAEADKTMSALKEERENTSWSLSALTDDFQKVSPPKGQPVDSYQSSFLEAKERMEERLQAINSQLVSMPDEIQAAKNAIAMFSQN